MFFFRRRDPWESVEFAGIAAAKARTARLLLNYADRRFFRAQKRCSATGREVGGFDHVLELRRADLPKAWRRLHADVLGARRGAGYWLWKPKLLSLALAWAPEGAIVCYCDSGARWIGRVDPYVALLSDTDALAFTLGPRHTDLLWTKAEARLAVGLPDALAREPQRLSSFILLRASPASRALVAEWLALCERGDLITDAPGRVPEPPGFEAHRHDQSLWSLVCKTHGVRAVRDPSQWGSADRPPHLPQVIDHDRWRA